MNLTPCPPLLIRIGGTKFLDFRRKIFINIIFYYILDEISIFYVPPLLFRRGERKGENAANYVPPLLFRRGGQGVRFKKFRYFYLIPDIFRAFQKD